jgi:hypothetical protein
MSGSGSSDVAHLHHCRPAKRAVTWLFFNGQDEKAVTWLNRKMPVTRSVTWLTSATGIRHREP